MFHPTELDPSDDDLLAAKTRALGILARATQGASIADGAGPPLVALESWAIVHGLVVLARSGSLGDAAAPIPPSGVGCLTATNFLGRVG